MSPAAEGTVADVLAGRARYAVVCGDATAVLASLPDDCAHVTYCDPGYGLSQIDTADVVACLTAWLAGKPYVHKAAGFMGHEWDSFVPGPEAWREVHRALRPGGYCVAFSSTRTVDLLGIAVRLAGFEMREGWAWVFGSGFPKSLDVSKAIDARKDWPALARLQEKVRSARTALGISQSEAARRIGIIGPDETLGGGGYMWFETGRVPTREQYEALKSALGLDDECDEAFAAAEREVIGQHRSSAGGQNMRAGIGGEGPALPPGAITAPATEAAAQWSGYGTTTKPCFEPLVVARKRMESPAIDIVGAIEDQMRHNGVQGHIRWKSERAASARKSSAEASSISTSLHVSAADSSAKNAGEQETLLRANETGSLFASSTEGTTPRTESRYSTRTARGREKTEKNCCLRTADDAPAAGNPDGSFSRSATSTETAGNTAGGATATPTETSSGAVTHKTDTAFCAGTATAPSASTDTALTVTFEGVRYEIARDGDCFVWPSGLAKFRAAESLTVAANVQRHGCGALNIDAARISADGASPSIARRESAARSGNAPTNRGASPSGWDDRTDPAAYIAPRAGEQLGRFPAALALVHSEGCEMVGTRRVRTGTAVNHNRSADDRTSWFGSRAPQTEDAGHADADGMESCDEWVCEPGCGVAELARQSGERPPGWFSAKAKRGMGYGGHEVTDDTGPASCIGDTGTAARFFWQAKASSADRLAFLTCAAGCSRHETIATARDARKLTTCPACGAAVSRHEHSTVKALDLARYHARLLSLPAHVEPLALVPYCGSGPEARALLEVGFRVIAVDLDPRHCAMTRHRLSQPLSPPQPKRAKRPTPSPAAAPSQPLAAPAAPAVAAEAPTPAAVATKPAQGQRVAPGQLSLWGAT